MYLDLRTLQIAAIVVCSVLGPVSLAFAPTQRYMQPSRFWGAGLVALACGLALVSLGGHGPDLVSQVLGPGLLALALTFAHFSARSTVGKGGRDVPGWTLLALFVLMLIALEQLSADARLRDLLGTGALGLLACRVAFGFDQGKALPEGPPLRMIDLSSTRRPRGNLRCERAEPPGVLRQRSFASSRPIFARRVATDITPRSMSP